MKPGVRTPSAKNTLTVLTTWLSALLITALLLGGCDTDFNPIQENDFHFSVFGFLDAAADSQFIRVTAVRDSIALAPGRPIDATVTLENLISGRKTTFQDSLFAFKVGFTERLAYNFWSPEQVEHETAYRLSVTRSDGAASTVSFTTPPDYPDPELLLPPGASFAAIRINKVERLVDLRIVFRFRSPVAPEGSSGTLTLSFLDRVAELSGGLGLAFNPYNEFFSQAAGCPLVEEAQVLVAAAGPDWPDFLAIDEETLALADVVTNVENGVGFVGGVSRKTLVWEALRGFLAGSQATCAQCTAALPDPRFCFGDGYLEHQVP